MPAYDYRCKPCDVTFEVIRSVDERGDVHCPECGATAMRVFSPVGVVFKGSGFHNTDYRTSSEKPEVAKKPSGEKKPACGEAKSCESCPAAKTE